MGLGWDGGVNVCSESCVFAERVFAERVEFLVTLCWSMERTINSIARDGDHITAPEGSWELIEAWVGPGMGRPGHG